jgi:hypothetical protein
MEKKKLVEEDKNKIRTKNDNGREENGSERTKEDNGKEENDNGR